MTSDRAGYGRNRRRTRWCKVVRDSIGRLFKPADEGSVRDLVDQKRFLTAQKRLAEHGGPKRDLDYLVKAQVETGLMGAAERTITLGASPQGVDCLLKAQLNRGLLTAAEKTVKAGASPQGVECLIKAKVKSGSVSSAEQLLGLGASPEGVDSAVTGWIRLGRYRKARDIAQQFGASGKVVKLLQSPKVSLTVRRPEVPEAPTVKPLEPPRAPKY
jgi:hypothetical protein